MKESTSGFVYIMASTSKTIYIGSTADIEGRVHQHKHGELGVFTKKYRCHRLVYYEEFETLGDARQREYEMKKWRREKKIAAINGMNPAWSDLSLLLFKD